MPEEMFLTQDAPKHKQGLREIAKRLLGQNIKTRLRLARLNLEKKIYKRPITKSELRAELLKLGRWEGRVVWVQSSWNEFYNVQAKPSELIDMMLDMVGPGGTLVMPAFPLNADPAKVLNIDSAPSSTGLLTELFRRHPHAHRSIHIRSSVAAVGPDAEYITKDHHLTEYAWGKGSPYERIYELRGLMVAMGFMPMGLTPLHHIECALHHKVPAFKNIFPDKTTYRWKRKDGTEGTHACLNRHGSIQPGRLKRYFVPDLLKERKLSNLRISGMPAFEGIERGMALARSGKTIYPPNSKRAE
jgi:aminoglycoside N3'-acetyltransferase